MQIIFTRAGFWRGAYRALPLAAGLAPFGFVTGLVIARHGLSLLDCLLMNTFVYAGAAQLVALANWTHPAPIVAAAFAAFVVNSRFALMGPVMAPWLDALRPAGRYANLAVLVDHAWAISVTDIRRGGRDRLAGGAEPAGLGRLAGGDNRRLPAGAKPEPAAAPPDFFRRAGRLSGLAGTAVARQGR
jgi:predicted branched-subunit amino acid permease